MAFDIYAGTFTRFHTRDWENVVQRECRLEGTPYTMICADGDAGPTAEVEVREAVSGWSEAINDGLSRSGLGPVQWSEDAGLPYFTGRPGWEGYGALQIWAAHAERPAVTMPHALPESCSDDRTWQAVTGDDAKIRHRAILQATIWLPGDFDFAFQFPTLGGDDAMIASTSRLLRELRELPGEPVQWGKPSFLDRIRKTHALLTRDAAEQGRASFERVVAQAVEARVPVMLSF